ncbi:MAG: hypothetical protein H0W61_05665 [Bacteroidetes bacterium]|nr:hypothetical protein [Bacteroidota bacterium]
MASCSRTTVMVDELMQGSGRTSPGGILVKDSVVKEHVFIRLDSTAMFGPLYTYHLQPEDKNKPIRLIITGKARDNYVRCNGTITYFLNDTASQYNWDGSNILYHITDLNKWCYFREEIQLMKNSSQAPYTKICVQAFLPNARGERFDLDSVNIKLVRTN